MEKEMETTTMGYMGGFPKLGVPFLGVPVLRIKIFLGLYWGPPILGNYQIGSTIRIHSFIPS